jgi:L-lactate dehydrogenase complex protein LldE
MVDLFRPRAGVAAVELLERRGVEVEFPFGQSCCGQFEFNAGHHRRAAAMARQLVRAFEDDAAAGSPAERPPVIALSGSCAAMIKHEIPELLERDALQRKRSRATAAGWRRRAEVLADRVVELSDWLDRRDAPGVATSGAPGEATGSGERAPAEAITEVPGGHAALKVAVHTNCHMRRLLGVTEPPLDVLRRAGAEPVVLADAEQCCGFGGSFAMLEPAISAALADAKLANLATARDDGAACLASSDLGCLMHLGGRLTRTGDDFPVLHLAELVDLADLGRLTPAEVERAARAQEATPDAG